MSIFNKLLDSLSSYTLNLTYENKFIIRGYRNFSICSVQEIIDLRPILTDLLKWCVFRSYYAEVKNEHINDVVDFFNANSTRKFLLVVKREVYDHIKLFPKTKLEFTEIMMEDEPEIALKIPKIEVQNTPFITFARRYENMIGEKANFVSFDRFYPNYNIMTKAQKKWYLYFRTELKKGNFLDTNLSYILLYIYEKINKIEWTNAEDTLQSLLKVWFYYRKYFSDLDTHLKNWCFDFIMLNLPNFNLLEYANLIYSKNIKINYLIKDLILTNHSLNDDFNLSINEIEYISQYKISKSKFYLSNYKDSVEEAIYDIFSLINKYFQKKLNKGILKTFSPKQLNERIEAYKGSIYELNPKYYTVTYIPFTAHASLKAFITSILKYTENVLRSKYEYKSKLKDEPLNEEHKKLIDEYFKRKHSKVTKEAALTLNIDMNRVESLKHDNIEIINILSSERIEEDAIQCKNDSLSEEIVTTKDSNDEFNFIMHMTIPQREILKSMLYEHNDKDMEEIANKYSLMLNILIDEINDLSLENIGDLIINTSPLSINEEYILKLKEFL